MIQFYSRRKLDCLKNSNFKISSHPVRGGELDNCMFTIYKLQYTVFAKLLLFCVSNCLLFNHEMNHYLLKQIKLLWSDIRQAGWEAGVRYHWQLIHRPEHALIRSVLP